MHKELEEKLTRRWPAWFNMGGGPRHTLMLFALQHGDSWFHIVRRLCGQLGPFVREFERRAGERFEVLEVKQKLGSLRFCPGHRPDAIRDCIEAAQEEPLRTCEMCGQPGQPRSGGWIQTLCDEHAEGRGAFAGWKAG
jgi:hypothetical protein